MSNENEVVVKSTNRLTGFALLSPEQRRELGRKGGATAHARGTARRWTPGQAREASAKAHARQTREV